jgi:diaminopimelate epimerase
MSTRFLQKRDLSFSKYEGAGNDFILIDDRISFFPTDNPILIQRLCHRRFGIGADGIILLQNDDAADFCMRIFNSNGSEAEGCGNGTRCLMRFLEEIGLPRKRYRIAVGSKMLTADFQDNTVSVDMGAISEWKTHAIDGREIHFVDSGVPHAVWFVPNVEQIPLHETGPLLRHHPLFAPRGANVNIATIEKEGSVRVRTFERGVEDETLACGTGATAVAAIGAKLYGWKSPVRIRYSGGDLDIHFDSALERIWMAGPAHKVFSGIVSI